MKLQSLSPDQYVSFLVNWRLYTTRNLLDVCLGWNKLCRLHIDLVFILSDVFRFSLSCGSVTLIYTYYSFLVTPTNSFNTYSYNFCHGTRGVILLREGGVNHIYIKTRVNCSRCTFYSVLFTVNWFWSPLFTFHYTF